MLSSDITSHVKRFGDYVVDVNAVPDPYERDFDFTSPEEKERFMLARRIERELLQQYDRGCLLFLLDVGQPIALESLRRSAQGIVHRLWCRAASSAGTSEGHLRRRSVRTSVTDRTGSAES